MKKAWTKSVEALEAAQQAEKAWMEADQETDSICDELYNFEGALLSGLEPHSNTLRGETQRALEFERTIKRLTQVCLFFYL